MLLYLDTIVGLSLDILHILPYPWANFVYTELLLVCDWNWVASEEATALTDGRCDSDSCNVNKTCQCKSKPSFIFGAALRHIS